MNTYDRRNKIIDLVNQNGSVMVADLSSSFDVSEVTIRSDLGLLEQKGALTRFHGGAAKRDASPADQVALPQDEMVLEERYLQASDPKKRIAQAAAGLVKPGDTVILDSGSTTMLLAEELVKSGDITVITNNLPAAFVLSENPDITLVVCGGTLRHKTRSLHGNITEYALQGIVANLMFVGADGLDAATGITTFNEGYSISGIMAAAAQRVVVVTDSTKFGRRGYNLVLPIEKIDTIITDKDIRDEALQALRQTSAELMLV
ncbi:DeoR/GlpR family DNA-binding transcription regulator [Rahnella sikkimica]|uniref:Transcriptional regulator n=1 Tax=Rahnella sikkimica TaxID=1805933 RepID=A0A2L1URT2_9GAMM|nr:DeoR/GlpR family DNA-binding transcription regulator [Rahnella sikkimica]AVF35669.1 transcriptional regulator [Rahnella sikkimica]